MVFRAWITSAVTSRTCLPGVRAISHSLVFLVLIFAGCLIRVLSDCPHVKDGKVVKCSRSPANLTFDDGEESLIDSCRHLVGIVNCLESVLNECQDADEHRQIMSLRNTTLNWKQKFGKLCNPILELTDNSASASTFLWLQVLLTMTVMILRH